jgi:hypothetical protein
MFNKWKEGSNTSLYFPNEFKTEMEGSNLNLWFHEPFLCGCPESHFCLLVSICTKFSIVPCSDLKPN